MSLHYCGKHFTFNLDLSRRVLVWVRLHLYIRGSKNCPNAWPPPPPLLLPASPSSLSSPHHRIIVIVMHNSKCFQSELFALSATTFAVRIHNSHRHTMTWHRMQSGSMCATVTMQTRNAQILVQTHTHTHTSDAKWYNMPHRSFATHSDYTLYPQTGCTKLHS